MQSLECNLEKATALIAALIGTALLILTNFRADKQKGYYVVIVALENRFGSHQLHQI